MICVTEMSRHTGCYPVQARMAASPAMRPSSTAKPAQSTPELMWNATCAVPPLELAAIAASAKQTKTPNPN